MAIPALGSVFTLECLGDAPGGPRFLDGRTIDGTVGLAGDFSTSGAQWALTRHAQDVVTLKCMGDVEGPRFLDGRTADHTVGLALHTLPPHSGTCWAVSEVADGVLTLRCLGHADGSRFLDGRTMDGRVGLVPDTGPAFSGTRWRFRVTGKLVMIFCLGHLDGARFLDGRTSDQSVGLSATTAAPFKGTRWHMIGDNDSFALKCLGTGGGGPWFLDGDTVGGRVRLVPHTGPPYSGTRWQFDRPTGDSTLVCLGDLDGVRFLDGRTVDGTVALVGGATPVLVGSTTPALSGTRWRILTSCPSSAMPVPDAFEPITVRVAQLTGSNDPEGRPVINDTAAWGAPGLDLGANCRYGDEVFLFLSDVARDDATNGPPLRDTDTVTWMDAPALGGHEAEGYNFVLPHVPTSLRGQSPWHYCAKCAVLFFDGDADKGVCAKGGSHSAAGLTFVVPSEPTDVAGQHEWRQCRKCKGMFFELCPDRGVCPAGGKHVAEGARLVLPFADVAGSRQANWRFCRWCRALFFAGDPDFQGACVADGNAFRIAPVLNGNLYDPFTVEGSIKNPLRAETPTGAFGYDTRIYVFLWIADARDATHPKGSYLVSKGDPSQPGSYREEFLLSDFGTAVKGFWQVAPWVVNNAEIRGLPSQQGDGLLMFGAGKESDTADAIHLAWMPLQPGRGASRSGGKVGSQRDTIQYLAEPRHVRRPRKKRWSPRQGDAAPLIQLPSQYTSLSVAWLAGPQRWILLYSKANNDLDKVRYAPSASVVAHIGTTPWDWSPKIEIFNPCREQAYGCYMHWPGFETIPQDVAPLAPPMNDQAGWAYGAHLLNRFTQWHPDTRMLDIYYLLSLHRPYQVQVMFTKLHLP